MNTETTYNDCAPVAPTRDQSATRGIAVVLGRAIRRVQRAILKYHWERHTARELYSLSSYVLNDIGLRRDEVRAVAAGMAEERVDSWARRAGGSNEFGS